MTAATIRASAAYRKRQAAKMKRYEAALREIATDPACPLWIYIKLCDALQEDLSARAALQEPSDA